jgi:hypothetical protein
MKFDNINVVNYKLLIPDNEYFNKIEKEVRKFITYEYCDIVVNKDLRVEIRMDEDFTNQGQFDLDLVTHEYIIRISYKSFEFIKSEDRQYLLYFQQTFLHELTHLKNDYSGKFLTKEESNNRMADLNCVMEFMINEYTAERYSQEKYPSCNRACLQDYMDRRKKLIESKNYSLPNIYNKVLYCISSIWSYYGKIEQIGELKNSPFSGITPSDKYNLDIIGQALSYYYKTEDMYTTRWKMENALKDFIIDLIS